MRKIIVLILLSSTVLAGEKEKAIELIDQASGYIKSMTTNPDDPLCENCSKELLFVKCVQDICTNGKIQENYEEVRNAAEKNLSKELARPEVKKAYNDIEKVIKDIMIANLDEFQVDLGREIQLRKENQFSDDIESQKVKVLMSLTHYLSEDEAKILPSNIKAIAKKYKDLISKYYPLTYMYSDTPSLHFKIDHPNLSLKDAINKDIESFENEYSKFQNSDLIKKYPSIKSYIADIYSTQFYKDFKAGKEFNIDDTHDLLEIVQALKLFNIIFNSPEYRDIKNSIDIEQLKSLMKSPFVDLKYQKLHGEVQVLASNLNSYSSYCANKILYAYLALPLDETKKNLNKISDDLRMKLKNRILSQVSEETRKTLNPQIDSIEFTTLSREDFLRKTKYDLNEELKSQKRTASINTEKSQQEILNEYSMNIDILKYAVNGDNTRYIFENVLSGDSICEYDLPSVIGDSSYSSAGRINVSWGSLSNINAGKAIMAHELGHQFSRKMAGNGISKHSSDMLYDFKLCLIKKHSKGQYYEEDFADTISALMEGPNGNNFACFFPQELRTNPLLNEDEEDGHSSHFFRLLHVENVMRGHIPVACQRYLKADNQSPDLKACFKSGTEGIQ